VVRDRARPTKGSDREQACSLQNEAEDLLCGSEFEVDSRAVLELVRDSDCSAYDCEFIALAIKLDTKLVTADKKVLIPDWVFLRKPAKGR
jgi:hypothetical protein